MDKLIEQAIEKAQEEFRDESDSSFSSEVDLDDFFTYEELNQILSDNDFFNGHVADLDKAQRHKKISQAAAWLNDYCMDVVSVETESTSKFQPNAIITVDIHRLSYLRDRDLKVFTDMCALADAVFFSALKDEVIRITFSVKDIWRE
jgi:hypothetical protein